MCNSQLIQGVSGGILAIVGIYLAMSGGNLWGRPPNWRIGVGLPLAMLGLFALVTSLPQYAIGFSVLATLALAFGAFLTIKSADEREKRRLTEDNRVRQEEIERDFKRRCLDDLENWAQKGAVLFVEFQPWSIPAERRQNLVRLAPLRAMNKWMMDASREIEKAKDDKEALALIKKVDEAAENLKQYCEVLEGNLSSGGSDIKQRHDQCLKSFTEVLERIADVKVKLKL